MSSFRLKLFALLLMIVDHIGYFFPQIPNVLIMRIMGRIVAPIFFFMLVEGYIYTHDKKKYIGRLLKSSIIMFLGNIVLLTIISFGNINIYYQLTPLVPNIFISMFLGLIILYNLDYFIRDFKSDGFKINQFIRLIVILIYIILSLYTEASIYGVFMIFIFYLLRSEKYLKFSIYILSCIIVCLLKQNPIQLFMIFAVIPLWLYNGKKGYSSKYSKYFFYVFYMIHIWLLIIISLLR